MKMQEIKFTKTDATFLQIFIFFLLQHLFFDADKIQFVYSAPNNCNRFGIVC